MLSIIVPVNFLLWKSQPVKTYVSLTIFILGWWWLAFGSSPNPSPIVSTQSLLPPEGERQRILEALNGDPNQMGQLIAEWDRESQQLNHPRLPQELFARSQFLSKLLSTLSKEQIEALNNSLRVSQVTDDTGASLSLTTPLSRFLPQTHAAATLLLALANPEEILALPHGMRTCTHLFSEDILNQIPGHIEDYSTESRYLLNPDVAFVSHYSNPAIIQSLREQGIPLFTLSKIDTPEDILIAVGKMGHIVNRPLQAELLQLFIQAAMQVLDNRIQSLLPTTTSILYLNHYTTFSLPSSKKLVWHFLNRMNINMQFATESDTLWNIPLTREQMLCLDPDCLMISTEDKESLFQKLMSDPAFSSLSAIQKGHLFFVDETIQQSPSQYIVLSYFDLYQAFLTYTQSARS